MTTVLQDIELKQVNISVEGPGNFFVSIVYEFIDTNSVRRGSKSIVRGSANSVADPMPAAWESVFQNLLDSLQTKVSQVEAL